MLIKRIKPWWMGKRCCPTLAAFIPTTPPRVQEGVKIFEGKAVVGGIWEVRAVSPSSPTSEAGLSKELKPGRLHGGKFSQEGWWGTTPTPCSPSPAGKGVQRQHRAQVPSKELFPRHSCLPSHRYQVGWIFLLENIFYYNKLWVNTILLTPMWGFRHQQGRAVPPLLRKCRNVPNAEVVWEMRAMTIERVLCFAASDAVQKRHFSLLCASHQHSPKHCIKNYSF